MNRLDQRGRKVPVGVLAKFMDVRAQCAAVGRIVAPEQVFHLLLPDHGGCGAHQAQQQFVGTGGQADGLAARVGRGVAHGRGLITVGRAMFSGTTGWQAQAFKLIDHYRLTIGQCAGAA